MLAWLRERDGVGVVMKRWPAGIRVAEGQEVAVPTTLDVNNIATGIDIGPNVFQLIQMLNIPVPPDSIFNGHDRRMPTNGRKADTAWKRVGVTVGAKNCVSDAQRQKGFVTVEKNPGCITDGQGQFGRILADLGGLGTVLVHVWFTL